MTSPAQRQLYRFLEDRFTCAQACAECARACAVHASLLDPDGKEPHERVRRLGIMCAEVCDATCRTLCEQNGRDEDGIRAQLEWCRSVCVECARAFDGQPGAGSAAADCRACASACADFMAALG
ncbi:ferredoxin [Streptomyces cellostaticus]|uniref:ferredoxin n=1 Tax=Streptomyces cellostaticus TaxID=67285 RepID=UPI0020260C41|nr:ferredoxin [Streptomyces cellostaticus]